MFKKIVHNWSLKLLALVIALSMWIYVVGQEKSEITVRVPIEITNIPSSVLVVGDLPTEVEARLFGPRTLIRRVSAERLSKAIDLNGLSIGANIFQVQPDDLRLPPGVRVLRISPDSFTITLAQRINREVAVQPVFKGRLLGGLRLGEVSIRPEKVLVVGSKEDFDEINWILTQPIDLGGRRGGFIQSVQLKLPKGKNVHLARDEVEVMVAVVNVSEESKLDVRLESINKSESRKSRKK